LAHAVRLEPGDDLVPCLLRAARMAVATTTTNHGGASRNNAVSSSTVPAAHHRPTASSSSSSSSSCVVLTAVGSLSSLTVRLANASANHASSPTTAGTDSKSEGDDALMEAANGEADSSCLRTWNECLEVTSLVGTFAVAAADEIDSTAATTVTNEVDSCVAKHLHITVSDGRGCAYGGHLVSGVVHTTLELVLGTLKDVEFRREHDPRTGYGELVVSGPTAASPPSNNSS
jgi:predicted DNA-binding protein with PD1-like motif